VSYLKVRNVYVIRMYSCIVNVGGLCAPDVCTVNVGGLCAPDVVCTVNVGSLCAPDVVCTVNVGGLFAPDVVVSCVTECRSVVVTSEPRHSSTQAT
jgi:hypothetical protein